MTDLETNEFLNGTFTDVESAFLLNHPEFKAAAVQATDRDLETLYLLAVSLLRAGGYLPPPASKPN